MYGSDYPDRNIKDTLNLTKSFMIKQNISEKDIDKIFYFNAKKFFNW